MISNYDKYPAVKVNGYQDHCWMGWESICSKINDRIGSLNKEKVIVVVECYQGVHHEDIEAAFRKNINHSHFYVSTDSFKNEREINEMVYPDVTDDRIFGKITSLTIDKYFERSSSIR